MTRCTFVLGLAVLASSASAAQKPTPIGPVTRAAVIDSVGKALATYYVLPDTAARMWQRVQQQRLAGVYDTIATAGALAQALTRDLRSVYNDRHLRFVHDPEEAQRAADTTRREAANTSARDRKLNYFFEKVEILPANIGYVRFTQFADTSAESRKTVRAAMQFVAHAEALIVDLRGNHGGSAAMSSELASYFVAGRAHWSDSYNRLTDQWTENWLENKPEITGGLTLGMPIAVLTNSETFSAGEGLAYTLQNNRGALVVGEPTAGGAHVLRRVGLGHGFVGYVPYIRGVNVVTRTDWEGTGVTPTLRTDAASALFKAQELLLTRRLAATTDTTEQRRTTWALNHVRAASVVVVVPRAGLAAYAGRFEEFTFEVRSGALYCINTSRRNKTDRMKPITSTLFEIDGESQVEFLRDEKGAVSRARLFWNDGWTDVIARNK